MPSQFYGIIKDIVEKGPNINLTTYLAESLHLPLDKAENLASRIKRFYEDSLEKEKHIRIFQKAEDYPKTELYSLHTLSQNEFEYFATWLLEELGFKIQTQQNSASWMLTLTGKFDEEKLTIYMIHCPITHCISDALVPIIREAKRFNETEKVLVITTAFFSQKARIAFEKMNVKFWAADVLNQKISQIRQKQNTSTNVWFPKYNGSLLKSIFSLEENRTFIITSKTDGKFDINLPGVKYPLLTFKIQNGRVSDCTFRIKYNEPVTENEGTIIVGLDEKGKRINLEEFETYNQIIKYLEQFLE